MDTNRSPGVGPLAWVTLGLLAFSWLVLGGLMARDWVRIPPTRSMLLTGVVIWLFVSGPHVMLGAAALRGARNPDVVFAALLLAVLYAGWTAFIGAGELTGMQWENWTPAGCCIWLLGWPIGIVALRTAFSTDRPQVPQDGG